MSKKTIAFFDFDGTVSRSDSLLLFLKFYFKKSTFVKLMSRFVPIYAKFKLGLIDNSRAKERLFEMAFSGEKLTDFNEKCKAFYDLVLKSDLKPGALKRMNEHIEQGDRVVLVSASIENYLEPFSREFKVEIICTQLEVIDGILTGNFKSPNCYGLEKVKRIKDEVDLSVYKEIHVYGDSAGDTEMLDLATHPFYRNFS